LILQRVIMSSTDNLEVLLSELRQGKAEKEVYVRPEGCGLFYLAENNMKVEINVRNEIVRERVRAQEEEKASNEGNEDK